MQREDHLIMLCSYEIVKGRFMGDLVVSDETEPRSSACHVPRVCFENRVISDQSSGHQYSVFS